jgi:hypothetical protein
MSFLLFIPECEESSLAAFETVGEYDKPSIGVEQLYRPGVTFLPVHWTATN